MIKHLRLTATSYPVNKYKTLKNLPTAWPNEKILPTFLFTKSTTTSKTQKLNSEYRPTFYHTDNLLLKTIFLII